MKFVEKTDNTSATILIGGMTCAACAQRVEKAVKKLAGILDASVNFATEKATVVYDPQKVRLSAIREAIEKAGYTALGAKNAHDEDRARKQKEIWTKFAVAAVFSLPLLYISMAPMIGFVKLPFPVWLDPMHNPLIYALAELILVIPVVGAGYRFYTKGFKALVERVPNMDSLIAIGTSAAFIFSIYNTCQIALGNHMEVE